MLRQSFFAFVILCAPASAGDDPELTGQQFTTPSRNISCIVQNVSLEGGNGPSKRLYCVRNLPTTISVVLDERGLESYITEGDQPFSLKAPVLHYSDDWSNGDFSCDSLEQGLFCRHQSYGSFDLSRKGLNTSD